MVTKYRIRIGEHFSTNIDKVEVNEDFTHDLYEHMDILYCASFEEANAILIRELDASIQENLIKLELLKEKRDEQQRKS